MENNSIQITNTTTFGEILNSYSPNVFQNTVFNDLIVFIDNYNQCWFHGIKVAEKLGYSIPQKAIRDHVNQQYKIKININRLGSDLEPNPLGGNPNITLIHEHGLYQLILSSQLPDVWNFQQWVFQVIENMRRYGIALSQQREQELYSPVVICPDYMRPIIDQMRSNMNQQQQMINNYQNQINELQNQLNTQQDYINQINYKASYYDDCMNNNHIIKSSQIAKDFNMSPQKLHTILHYLNIIYPCNDDWIINKKYENKGYTKTQNKNNYNIITGWTEQGRQFIYDLLINNGYSINN